MKERLGDQQKNVREDSLSFLNHDASPQNYPKLHQRQHRFQQKQAVATVVTTTWYVL